MTYSICQTPDFAQFSLYTKNYFSFSPSAPTSVIRGRMTEKPYIASVKEGVIRKTAFYNLLCSLSII